MSKRGLIRMAVVLAAALGFGLADSLFKGDYAGLRGGIGNLAAPWIVLPLACAALAVPGRPGRGAVVGLSTTVVALVGFYVANTFVLGLTPHSSLNALIQSFELNGVWFKAGVLSGPLMGALGAWAIQRGRFPITAIAAGAMLLEPIAVWLYIHLGLGEAFAPGNSDWREAYTLEAVAGIAAALVLWGVHGRRRIARRR